MAVVDLIATFTAIGMNFFVRGFPSAISLMGTMEYIRLVPRRRWLLHLF